MKSQIKANQPSGPKSGTHFAEFWPANERALRLFVPFLKHNILYLRGAFLKHALLTTLVEWARQTGVDISYVLKMRNPAVKRIYLRLFFTKLARNIRAVYPDATNLQMVKEKLVKFFSQRKAPEHALVILHEDEAPASIGI